MPEVVEQGRGGIIVDDYREMPDAIAEADRLDPAECRRSVEERFSPQRMVGRYVDVYRAVVEGAA